MKRTRKKLSTELKQIERHKIDADNEKGATQLKTLPLPSQHITRSDTETNISHIFTQSEWESFSLFASHT